MKIVFSPLKIVKTNTVCVIVSIELITIIKSDEEIFILNLSTSSMFLESFTKYIQ